MSGIHLGRTIVFVDMMSTSVVAFHTVAQSSVREAVILGLQTGTIAVVVISMSLVVDCIVYVLRGDFVAYQYGMILDVSRQGFDQLVFRA